MTRQWQENDNKHDKKKDKKHKFLAKFIFLEFQHLLSFFCHLFVMFLPCFIVFLYVCMLLVCDVSCLTVLFQFSHFCAFVSSLSIGFCHFSMHFFPCWLFCKFSLILFYCFKCFLYFSLVLIDFSMVLPLSC